MPLLDKKNIKLSTPLDKKMISRLRVGDEVFLSGVIFTARDQAHERLATLIRKGKRLSFDLKDQVIYYCGPTKTAPGRVFGSCGPTTSSRMDRLSAPLLHKGLKGMIGKGRRSEEVRRLIKKYKAVYFLATGGAGALLSRKVIAAKPVCFKELGPEAVYELIVKDFPLIVGIDSKGRDIFNLQEDL